MDILWRNAIKYQEAKGRGAKNTKGGSITVPLTSCLIGLELAVWQLTFFCFYLQNRLIQTSQTGGQWYNDTPPFSIPWGGAFTYHDGHGVGAEVQRPISGRWNDESEFPGDLETSRTQSGKSCWRGRLSTVDLLVLTRCTYLLSNAYLHL